MSAYVFDNGPLRIILSHYYIDRFPKFWENFNDALGNQKVISVREVFNELSNNIPNEELIKWIEDNKEIFRIPSSDEGSFIQNIFSVKHFQENISKKNMIRGYPVADPFVISKAAIENRIVVTEEKFTENASKIPNICNHFEIEWTNLHGFLQRENWNF